RFHQYFLYYRDLDFSLDISRVKFPEDFFEKMHPKIEKAFAAMRELEAGAIANPTEKRMVGHYWLRNPALAPTPELRTEIEDTIRRIKSFAEDVHGIMRRAERVCHQLWSKRRTADTDQQHVPEGFSIFGRDFLGMNIFGEAFDAPDGVFNFCAELRGRRKRRIAEPVMAYHPFFGGISDCPRFQLSHRRKRLLDFRVHFLEEILRKFHPADVERKIEIAVVQQLLLERMTGRR